MKEVDYLITVDVVPLFSVIMLIMVFVFMCAFLLGMFAQEQKEKK